MSTTADIKQEIHNAELVPMTELLKGENGEVVQINTKGLLRQRLMEMGLTTGVNVKFLRRGAFGDPKSYLIRGTMIALRNEEAGKIIVRRIYE
ncbi:MAG: ferrous iron transport protein A [Candidatus Marinimicrobia bacterium]|nr:ferrous iron transport protein A [Candidatus Neomarinimicrobiota bacterium]